MQVGGTNYLVPIDAKLAHEGDFAFEAVKLDLVLEQLEREASTALVFLDACRDNSMAQMLARSMGTRSVNIGRGLARIDSGAGTFIGCASDQFPTRTPPRCAASSGHKGASAMGLLNWPRG
jgi:uncharacterized caspase-like protein